MEDPVKIKRERIKKTIEVFTESAKQIKGIIELYLFGSVVSDPNRIPKDMDFIIFIEDTACIEELAKCYRKTYGANHYSIDAFVYDKNKAFLGNICYRKECPTSSVDCYAPGCGDIKYIKRTPGFEPNIQEIFETKTKLLWRNPACIIPS